MKKNKKEILIISVMILVLIIGVTYAFFLAIANSSTITVNSKTLKLSFEDNTNIINAENIEPIYDEEIDDLAVKKTFEVAKTEDSNDLYIRIEIIDIVISDNFKDSDLRWALYDSNGKVTEGSFVNIKDGNKISLANNIFVNYTELKEYTLYIWIRENDTDQERLKNGSLKGKIEVEGRGKLDSGIDNEGKLAEGMIPVIYDEASDSWIKAGGSLGWYDYDNQMWANAVTVYPDNRSKYFEAKPGTTISMDDINTMWVWIPRYKYKIPSDIGTGSKSNLITNPPEIDVVFETGLSATGVDEATYRSEIKSDGTNENYYTHPAFRNGEEIYNDEQYDIGGWDKELEGIWMAKFETGTDSEICNNSMTLENCKDVEPIIKPDVLSLRYQYINEQIITSVKFAGGKYDESTGDITFDGNNKYGLDKTVDTHVSKNTEWGMVAILSQSKYGKKGNQNFVDESKKVFVNNSKYTGRSGGYASGTMGSYTYNDFKCDSEKNINCTTEKEKYKGVGASTTGTIYGIYDMNGNSGERTMVFSISGVGAVSLTYPQNKYYDAKEFILGDATWETKYWGNTSTYISGLFIRGSEWGPGDLNASIFSYDWCNGVNKSNDRSFRTILIP